jgi:hypothetical protein
MKKFLYVFILSFALLQGCNKNSPNEVAKNWLTSFYHLDYDAAKKLSTDDTKNFISQLQQFSEVISDSDKKELRKTTITIKDVKINGNNASVIYNTSDMPGKDQPLSLIKQNDKWLVQFSKSDQAGAAADTVSHQAMEPDTSATQATPADDSAQQRR